MVKLNWSKILTVQGVGTKILDSISNVSSIRQLKTQRFVQSDELTQLVYLMLLQQNGWCQIDDFFDLKVGNMFFGLQTDRQFLVADEV